MAQLTFLLRQASDFIWGPWLLIPLLLFTGLYLTLRLKGLQFKELYGALYLALIVRKDKGATGDISHFQALMTALAATVGTGNIVGVATAIALGGPGAVFWMWMTGLLGMATKYSEALLAVHYRVTDHRGEQAGGPMYYLSRGIRAQPLGKIPAFSSRSSQQSRPSGLATWCNRTPLHKHCTRASTSPSSSRGSCWPLARER